MAEFVADHSSLANAVRQGAPFTAPTGVRRHDALLTQGRVRSSEGSRPKAPPSRAPAIWYCTEPNSRGWVLQRCPAVQQANPGASACPASCCSGRLAKAPATPQSKCSSSSTRRRPAPVPRRNPLCAPAEGRARPIMFLCTRVHSVAEHFVAERICTCTSRWQHLAWSVRPCPPRHEPITSLQQVKTNPPHSLPDAFVRPFPGKDVNDHDVVQEQQAREAESGADRK